MVWLVQNYRSNKCLIPKIPRASGGKAPPWAPYQASTLDQLGTLSGPQTPRLLTPPLTTNPGSAPDYSGYIQTHCQKIRKLNEQIKFYLKCMVPP